MSEPLTCPKCGVRHPAGTAVCGCGHPFAAVPAVERPFDIGKPFGTAHPVSAICPACGGNDYKSVQPATMVSFTWDRVCKACSTRYTPPTPAWARAVFGVVGLAALGGAAVMAYGTLTGAKHQPMLGLITPLVIGVVGAGCLYKAATR
ncbi:MAG: hypothetical protein U0746_16985 [Gemmataceae bacterium]